MDTNTKSNQRRLRWVPHDTFRHDWHLMENEKEMASLVCTGPLRSSFEGHFQGIPYTIIIQEFPVETAFFSEKSSGRRIGTYEKLVSKNSYFKMSEDGIYKINLNGRGYWFTDADGNPFAITTFNYRKSFFLKPEFILMDKNPPINSWLIAVISLFYAIYNTGPY